MTPQPAPAVDPTTDEAVLREVIDTLAPIERLAGGDGEREAAQWLAERLRAAGAEVQVEPEEFYDGYAGVHGRLAALAAVAGTVGLASRRLGKLAALAAAGAGLGLADDISNGPRVARRAIAERKTTQNVVATLGDPDAERTLVLLAHHDAARTGAIFDDRAQTWFGETFPGLLERIDTSLPILWAVLAGPALVSAGAARGRRGMLGAGAAASGLAAAAFADIARSAIVPGASDNLTACAVLVALAERLKTQPIPAGLRILLVSCGAEEVMQGGIYGFARRHFPELDRARTWVLNLETLGSSKLIMLEGEGPVVMEDYHDRDFRELIARAAERAGVPMRRGMRARNPTDAVIPSRAGYPTATLCSMNRVKALAHYHQMSDSPENVEYRTVRAALEVSDAVARELAASPWL